ncbi:MAG: MotA/TolQ/ExbB proton channel family protein, partial [Halarcobacter sp.]
MIELNEKKISHSPRFLMILSLPLALFLLLLLGFTNIIPLKVEIHSIIIIFLILLIFMFFIPHNAWYSFSNFRNSLSDVVKEVDNYLLENELLISGKKKSYGNIDSFFEKHINNIRNDNFSSIASSIFPTLGILGTFTAIAISMPNFTVESKAALENEITILLSGVGTAFYASIYGIFLSIWWIFFEKRGMTKIENDLNEIKNQYKQYLWSKEEFELYKIIDNQEKNEKFLEKIENVITPEYIYKLDSIAKAKLELIEKINEEFKNSEQRLSKNYLTLTKLFEATSMKQNTILDDFVSLHDSILKTNEALDKSINEQDNNSKAIRNETYSV